MKDNDDEIQPTGEDAFLTISVVLSRDRFLIIGAWWRQLVSGTLTSVVNFHDISGDGAFKVLVHPFGQSA